MLLIAQIGGMPIIHWIIVIIVVAAAIGIMYVALQQFGVQIPDFVVKIFWICVVAVVAILAVKFIAGIW